jgi:signal transduction histidine kinase
LQIAAREGRWLGEGWRVRNDGTYFWASVVITALRDPSGTLVGFAKVTRDLTDRRRAEVELAQSLETERSTRLQAETDRERLAAIGEVTEAALSSLEIDDLLQHLLHTISGILKVDTVSILLLDEFTGMELVARAVQGIEDPVGSPIRIPLGEGFIGRVAAERRPMMEARVERTDAYSSLLHDKGIQSVVGVPLIVQGNLLGVLCCGSLLEREFTDADITLLQIVADRVALAIEHARLVEVTIRARQDAERAEAAVRVQDEFLTVAAHELKTPMTSLRLATQLLLRRVANNPGPETDGLAKSLHTIERQSARMSHLVTQLLEAVRLKSGDLQLQPTEVDVTEMVEQLVYERRQYSSLHTITLTGSPHIDASVDALRLKQVMASLLDNAIKYSPAGGEIEVSVEQPSDDRVRITVRDHGIGVPTEHRAALFSRFYQAHGEDYRSGMGLGLFVSREIVARHGGEIRAEFPEDGGSRFVVELPIRAKSALQR